MIPSFVLDQNSHKIGTVAWVRSIVWIPYMSHTWLGHNGFINCDYRRPFERLKTGHNQWIDSGNEPDFFLFELADARSIFLDSYECFTVLYLSNAIYEKQVTGRFSLARKKTLYKLARTDTSERVFKASELFFSLFPLCYPHYSLCILCGV